MMQRVAARHAAQDLSRSRGRPAGDASLSAHHDRDAASSRPPTLTVETPGEGFTDITRDVPRFVDAARRRATARCLLFLRHTSASLTIQENADPDVQTRPGHGAAPARAARTPAGSTTPKGPDDMPAHVKAMLTGVSLHIPVLRRRAGARHLAGHLSGRAPGAAAPARGRAAIHRQRAEQAQAELSTRRNVVSRAMPTAERVDMGRA